MFPSIGHEPGHRAFLKNLLLHFRPTNIPEPALRFTLSWGLGGMTVVLFSLLLITGMLMKFIYVPTPAQAYASIGILQDHVLFGKLIRNIHYWAANLVVGTTFLHMLRTFFTGGFYGRRGFTWVIGLCLFLLVLGSGFTGYLLPWDQLAFWAVTICTGMLDYLPGVGPFIQEILKVKPEIGEETLRIFYSLHTAVFPALIVVLMAFHFWRVRKAGGLVLPPASGEDPSVPSDRISTVPDLLLRELVTALGIIALVLIFSIFFNAPLDQPANPGLSPNPTKAPWYFAGLQEMLLHFHPTVAAWVIPFMGFAALLVLPYLKYEKEASGVWFISHTGRKTALMTMTVAIVLTPVYVFVDAHGINLTAWFSENKTILIAGIVPLLFLIAVLAGIYWVIRKRFSGTKNEAIQAVFVFVCVGFVMLTVINIWFRGQGMVLKWSGSS